ncbi:MAG: hypothetical protein KF908_13985 [Nitrosomonas sp.]|nr:hypothetical protein [Nitrosomonas sp.]MCW5609021.1 hypothetical protein [Nitrosomonas sp.]
MSGYFQRLIARSMGTGSDVRPLSPQPYADLPHEKLQTGNDAPLTIINTPHSAGTAEAVDSAARGKVPLAETTGVANTIGATGTAGTSDSSDSPVSIRHTDASVVTDGMPGTRTTAAGAMIDSLPDSISGAIPQHPPHAVVNHKPLLGPHAVNREETVDRPAEQAAQRAAGEATEATEAFHLMPLQPPSLAHNTVSSSTVAPFSPFSPVRAETAALSQTHLSAPGQYNHQPAVSESPTIQVTIGRVEIRAAVASAPARKTSARSPAMNLDDYLKQRNGGRR